MPTVQAVRWVGAYLTNGRRLVQVLDLDDRYLLCDDVSAPVEDPEPVVRVSLHAAVNGLGGWRLVREGAG